MSTSADDSVVTDTLGRRTAPRRQHTLEEKRRIVEETHVKGASVSGVARRHEVNANQVFAWRQLYRRGPLDSKLDSFNRRNIVIVGIMLWSVMTASCGLARHFGAMFVFRMGVGLGEATLTPPAYSIIADYFPTRSRGRFRRCSCSCRTSSVWVSVQLRLRCLPTMCFATRRCSDTPCPSSF